MIKQVSYTVIYRTGGTLSCQWHRCSATFNHDAAKIMASNIERMGYKVLIHKTEVLDTIGMPVGWEP